MTDAEKIHRLTRALEAIAGFAYMNVGEWDKKYPDIVEKWVISSDSAMMLSTYAKEKLEEINGS